MLPEKLDAVTASYHRCMHGEGFVDTFYQIFLGKSSEVAHKFQRTDFSHQKRMLRQSLLLMVLYNHHSSDAQEDLEALAERHSRRGVDIPPRLYALWLDALCEAIERHDPDADAELIASWRAAMKPGIDLLISHY